jgi:hypothetical protein
VSAARCGDEIDLLRITLKILERLELCVQGLAALNHLTSGVHSGSTSNRLATLGAIVEAKKRVNAPVLFFLRELPVFRRDGISGPVKEGAPMADTDNETEVQKALDALRAERREIIQNANKDTAAGRNFHTALSKVQEIQVIIDVLKLALADEKSCRQADTASMIAPGN